MKNLLVAAGLASAVALAGAAAPAVAQMTDDAYYDSFAFNNSLFVMYHEIGHLLIGELGLPVLGREEDAADALAALLLLVEETDEADQALIDSADGWSLSDAFAAEDSSEYDLDDFYGEHSLDLQRSFAAVCMMVGSNIEVFGSVATEFGMDEDRQESCAFTFQQAASSWFTVLEPHMSENGPSVAVNVSYQASENFPEIAAMLEDGELLEYAATQTVMGFDLPRDITIVAAECGEVNAYYDPEVGEITFCYELAQYFRDLIVWASAEQ